VKRSEAPKPEKKAVQTFLASLTILVSIASAAFAGASAWLAMEQNEGSREAARTSKAHAVAAEKTASSTERQAISAADHVGQASRLVEATTRQVNLSSQSLMMMNAANRIEHRAYVHVVSARLFQIGDTLPMIGNAVFQNTGRTPALNFRIVRSLDFQDYPSAMALAPVLDVNLSPARTLAAGSDAQSPVVANALLTAEQLQIIRTGNGVVHFRGTAQYEDVFGETHQTSFHMVWGGPWGAPDSGQMSAFESGNDAN
jgi:hypothetical protein